MSTESNKAAVRRIFEEGFNKGNLSVADEVISPSTTTLSILTFIGIERILWTWKRQALNVND